MKSQLRQHISPSVPFILNVSDETGGYKLSFRLSYDFNAFAAVEGVLGKSMLTDVGELLENPSATNVSVLLWAAVQENHPEYVGEQGLRAIRSYLNTVTAKEAREACSAAYVKQLPAEKLEELRKIQAEREAGVTASPLAQSPAPAAE